MGEKIDFVGNGTSKVIERFSDIRRVIVGFIRVLRAMVALKEVMSRRKALGAKYVTCRSFWWTCLSASTRFSSSM